MSDVISNIDKHRKILLRYCRICGSCDRSIDQLPNRKTDSEFVTNSLKFLNVDLDTFTFKNEDPDVFPFFICYICYRKLNYFENTIKQGKTVNKIDIATFEKHSDNCNICLRKQTKVPLEKFDWVKDKLLGSNVFELHPESKSLLPNGSHCDLEGNSKCKDSTQYINQDITTEGNQDESRFQSNSSPRLIMALSPENSDEAHLLSECDQMTDRKLKVLDTGEINAKITQFSVNKSIEENFLDDNIIQHDIISKNSNDSLKIVEKENEDPLCFDNSDLGIVKNEKISELESTSSVNNGVENLVMADSSMTVSRNIPLNHDLSHEDRLAYFCRLCGQMKIGISESSIGLLKTSHNVQKHIRKILQVNVFDEPSTIYPPAVCLECCDMLKSNFLSLSACRKLNNLDLKIVAFEPHQNKSCFICSTQLPMQCCNESSIYEEKSGKFFPISHKEVIMQSLKSEEISFKDINTKVAINSSTKCVKKASVSKYFKTKFVSQKMKVKFVKNETKTDLKLGKVDKSKGTNTLTTDKYFGNTNTYDDYCMNFKWKRKPLPKPPSDNNSSKKLKPKIFNATVGAISNESCLNKKIAISPKLQTNVEMSSVPSLLSDNLTTKVSKSKIICMETPNRNVLHKSLSALDISDRKLLWEEERRKAVAIMNEVFLKISEKLGENFDESTFKKLICTTTSYDHSVENIEEVRRMIFMLSQILTLLDSVLKGDKFNNYSKERRKQESSFECYSFENKSYSVCTGLPSLGNEDISQTSDNKECVSTSRTNLDSCYNLRTKHDEIYIDCSDKSISNNLIQVTHPTYKKIELDSDSLSCALDTSVKENILDAYESSVTVKEKLSKLDLPADLSSIEADVVSYLASSKLQNISSQLAFSPSCDDNPKCSLFNNPVVSPGTAETLAVATTNVANEAMEDNSLYNFKAITISHCESEPDQATTFVSNLHSNNFEEKFEKLSEKIPGHVKSDNFENVLSDDEDMLCPEVIEKLMGLKANQALAHTLGNELNHYAKPDLEYNRSTPIIISQTPESVTISIPESMNEPISGVSTLKPEIQQFANCSAIQSLLNEANTTKDAISNDPLPLILEKSSVASISQEDFKAINNDGTLCVGEIGGTSKKSSKKVVVKKHQCPVCAKFFRKPCDVRRHLRTHTGEKPFKCEFCDRMFSVQSTLRMHQKLHMENRLIQCDVCSASFNNLGLLKSHKKSHKSSLYSCSFCPHKFLDSHHWKRHVNIHHSSEISVKDIKDDTNAATEKIPGFSPLKISSIEIAAVAKSLGTTIIPSNDLHQKNVDFKNEKVSMGLIANSPNRKIRNTEINFAANTSSKPGGKEKILSSSIKDVSEMTNVNVIQRENTKASSEFVVTPKSVSQKSTGKQSISTPTLNECEISVDIIENLKCKRSDKNEQCKYTSKVTGENFKISNYLEKESVMPSPQKFCYNESHSLSNLYQAIVGESIEEDNAENVLSSVGNLKSHAPSSKYAKFIKPYDRADFHLKSTISNENKINVNSHDSKQVMLSSFPQITLEKNHLPLSITNEYEQNYDNQSEITVNTDGSYSLEERYTENLINLQNTEKSSDDTKNTAMEKRDNTKVSDNCLATKSDVKFDFKLKNSLGCKLKLVEVNPEKITTSKKKIDYKIDEATQQLRERGINVEPVYNQISYPDSNSSGTANLKNSRTNSFIVQVGIKEVGRQQMQGNKLKQVAKLEKVQSLVVEPVVASLTTSESIINDNIEFKVNQKTQIYNKEKGDSTSILNCVKSDNEAENPLPLSHSPQKLQLIKPKAKITVEKNVISAIDVASFSEKDVGETCIQLSNDTNEISNERPLCISVIDAPIKCVGSPLDLGKCFQKTSKLKNNEVKKSIKKIKLDVLPSNKCRIRSNSNELNNSSEAITLEIPDNATKELKVPVVKEEEDSIVISWEN